MSRRFHATTAFFLRGTVYVQLIKGRNKKSRPEGEWLINLSHLLVGDQGHNRNQTPRPNNWTMQDPLNPTNPSFLEAPPHRLQHLGYPSPAPRSSHFPNRNTNSNTNSPPQNLIRSLRYHVELPILLFG